MARTLAVCLVLAVFIPPAVAGSPCKVTGHFEARSVQPGAGHCPSSAQICTAGRVWGGIQGDYQFVASGLLPSSTIGGTPSVFFFAGQSNVTLNDGTTAVGTDTGSIDLPPQGTGGFASLITFTTGAVGQIRLRGRLDAETGVTSGDYTGNFCRP